MFYALKIDSNGNGVGAHVYAEQPDALPVDEIASTAEQAQQPTNWKVEGATLVSAPLPLAQQAAAAINAGLTITLSGSFTLAATLFPTDPVTTGKIGTVVNGIADLGMFPNGASAYPMKDATGAWHSFTAAQYKAVVAAIFAYVAALDLILDGNPTNATALPLNSVSITV